MHKMPWHQAVCAAATAVAVEAANLRSLSVELQEINPDATLPTHFRSSATGGSVFSMEKIRTYDGPRLDHNLPQSTFPPPGESDMCERWAVLTSIFEPTDTVKQLADAEDWCVVVVGDKNGPTTYDAPGVIYLTPDAQEALPYQISTFLPWNHFGRKNVGYLYAVHHGAKVIYDVDDDNAMINPAAGVPYADLQTKVYPTLFSGGDSSRVHNPYPCFDGPGNAWPRGFPLESINDPDSTACGLDPMQSTSDAILKDGTPRRPLGVVQSLANHDPDVDAIYRLTFPPGGLPFNFAEPLSFGSKDSLRGVPSSGFTPYNAQATLHFEAAFWGMLLPVTVHGRVSDIWRSYFTQTLLPSVGAAVAFAPAWVEQFRNPHNYLADFQAELPLYQRGGALASFLFEYASQLSQDTGFKTSTGDCSSTLPERVETLTVTMYEYGILEIEDVTLSQAWLQDLSAAGYPLPPCGDVRPVVDGAAGSEKMPESSNPPLVNAEDRPHVLLTIAVVSGRPDRRQAIRDSWMGWADDRVLVRFFTEAPNEKDADGRDEAAALAEEMATFGDVEILEISPGMNFALKLVEAMRWMSERYTFDFFLRLDDDYFLCLKRLLDELDATSKSLAGGQDRPMIYAGSRYCIEHRTRIDEAYALLSGGVVDRVLSTPDLECGAHAGTTMGVWFTKGQRLNKDGDVEWVHDERLDHVGQYWKVDGEGADRSQYSSVCVKHMGIHHSYVGELGQLWAEAKGTPAPASDDFMTYRDDGSCSSVANGVSNQVFAQDDAQLCADFHTRDTETHCGAEGC